uniref:Putative coat protein n=1 Tax=Bemisia tabaci virga-like virus 1 TaxID=2766749 RepID=A0A8E8KRV3_9VIRU|nr:putative coat protein [Bemisia tabaci virga-like virus 1]
MERLRARVERSVDRSRRGAVRGRNRGLSVEFVGERAAVIDNRDRVVRRRSSVEVEERVNQPPFVPEVLPDPVHQNMYQNWGPQHRRLQNMAWCSSASLRTFVHDYQHVGFYIHINRRRVLEAYQALRGQAPFNRETRFPEDDDYVWIDGPLKKWFEQALQALDLPDRAIEKGGERSVDVSMSDAKRSYDVAMQKIAAFLACRTSLELSKLGIYDRETFESNEGLNWVAN